MSDHNVFPKIDLILGVLVTVAVSRINILFFRFPKLRNRNC